MTARILSIAPMIDITHLHFRQFMRLITKRTTLYTQMIHQNAIIHHHSKYLPFNQIQHPIVLQIGGSQPNMLAEAAIIAQKYGYDAINLNVGCPSIKVQHGTFGASLMKNKELVRQCVKTMSNAVAIPCTVKCRLGVDQFDSYQFIRDFIDYVSEQGKGINHFIIHARKALLKGLNPTENRTIPPLMHDRVFRLKQQFPALKLELNGGITSIYDAFQIAQTNDLYGCMVGRLAQNNPFCLIKADQLFYGETNINSAGDDQLRVKILFQYADYIHKLRKQQITDKLGNTLADATNFVLMKPLLNIYHGQANGGKWRQYFAQVNRNKCESLPDTIKSAANYMYEKSIKSNSHQHDQQQIDQSNTNIET